MPNRPQQEKRLSVKVCPTTVCKYLLIAGISKRFRGFGGWGKDLCTCLFKE
jgi:hypothetical protein